MNKHQKISGTSIDLVQSFDNPFNGYGDYNHPMSDLGRTSGIKESFQYVNESIHPIGITGTNGVQMEIKGSYKNLNRLVIIREITFGCDIKVNLGGVETVMGKEAHNFVSYVANVIEREKGNQSRTIRVYYILDTSKLAREPDGLYLNQVGVLVYSPGSQQVDPTLGNRRPVITDENTEDWGATLQLIHVPERKEDKYPTFVMVGNRILRVEATNTPGLKPGMHLITNGCVKIIGSKDSVLPNIYSEHIKPEDYANAGFYESGNKLIEGTFGKTRSSSVADILKVFEAAKETTKNEKPSSYIDRYKVFGMSIRECANELGETVGVFNKAKDQIKSTAR